MEQRSEIIGALMSEPGLLLPPDEKKENVLRLDIYYSETNRKAYIQLFKYVPYIYEPASILYECSVDDIKKLLI